MVGAAIGSGRDGSRAESIAEAIDRRFEGSFLGPVIGSKKFSSVGLSRNRRGPGFHGKARWFAGWRRAFLDAN
jgi:hypothetical protein